MENQITKGKWYFSLNSENGGNSIGTNIYNGVGAHPVFFTTNENTLCSERAKLICETFNVTQETGKTPRQLADENKMLLHALETIYGAYSTGGLTGLFKEEILVMKEAINKATK